MEGKVIAVWGSPGDGKTLTGIKLSWKLAKSKKNVVLVLCDNETPMVPLLIPPADTNSSLGHLLALPALTEVDVFQHFIPLKRSFSILGYLRGENENTYADYGPERAKELIHLLRDAADYVVIDCSHHLLSNVLTAVALEVSDTVLRVVNCGLKSLLYIESQRPYLQETRFHYENQINILNRVTPSQDVDTYQNVFGGKAYILPYLPELEAQYNESRLLEPVTGRDGKKYDSNLNTIIRETITSAK